MSDYIWLIAPIIGGLGILGVIICSIIGCVRRNQMQTTISGQAFSKNNTVIATAQATPVGGPFNNGFNPAMNMMNNSNMGMLNTPMPMAAPYDPLNPINNNIAGGMQQSLMNNF
jgi:hypothetical protein